MLTSRSVSPIRMAPTIFPSLSTAFTYSTPEEEKEEAEEMEERGREAKKRSQLGVTKKLTFCTPEEHLIVL